MQRDQLFLLSKQLQAEGVCEYIGFFLERNFEENGSVM